MSDDMVWALYSLRIHRAMRLIEDPRRWIKGASAIFLPIDGEIVQCYCMSGALNRASNQLYKEGYKLRDSKDYEILLGVAREELEKRGIYAGRASVQVFNDHPDTTHDMVMAAMREAHRRALRQEVSPDAQ